eukprot:snap_masked-scaffold_17-processed-gene-3.13-mRNA-1 protein AED:1.00 eAED:1.00 QI:0/0/0/0/1/1/2/0/70
MKIYKISRNNFARKDVFNTQTLPANVRISRAFTKLYYFIEYVENMFSDKKTDSCVTNMFSRGKNIFIAYH